MDTRNMANPTIRTANGEAEPVKPTSSARVKATLLEGATFATETTKSPHRFTAFAFRPTDSCDSLTETTAVPPPTLAGMSDRRIGYVSTIVKTRSLGVKGGGSGGRRHVSGASPARLRCRLPGGSGGPWAALTGQGRSSAHGKRAAGRPFVKEQAEGDAVGEGAVDPGGLAHGALQDEAGPDGGGDHRVVVGQGSDLDPVQAADREAVMAQHSDDVGAQVPAAEGRAQHEPDLRVAVVQVDAGHHGLPGQVRGGQLDDGEPDDGITILGLPVRRVGGSGRDRQPRPARGSHPGLDVGQEFGLEGLDVGVGGGTQSGPLSA